MLRSNQLSSCCRTTNHSYWCCTYSYKTLSFMHVPSIWATACWSWLFHSWSSIKTYLLMRILNYDLLQHPRSRNHLPKIRILYMEYIPYGLNNGQSIITQDWSSIISTLHRIWCSLWYTIFTTCALFSFSISCWTMVRIQFAITICDAHCTDKLRTFTAAGSSYLIF